MITMRDILGIKGRGETKYFLWFSMKLACVHSIMETKKIDVFGILESIDDKALGNLTITRFSGLKGLKAINNFSYSDKGRILSFDSVELHVVNMGAQFIHLRFFVSKEKNYFLSFFYLWSQYHCGNETSTR